MGRAFKVYAHGHTASGASRKRMTTGEVKRTANSATSAEVDALAQAVGDVLPPLLTVFEALDWFARQLHPPDKPALIEAIAGFAEPFASAREAFAKAKLPPRAAEFQRTLAQAAEYAGRALEGIVGAADDQDFTALFRAMGQRNRALAALYPLCPVLPPVNSYFLDRDCRNDEALLASLADGGGSNVGVIHASNGRDERGGWSLYVPEYYDAKRRYPLIVALHGGSGHGRDFLWTWLPTARSRGAILLCPTAIGRTWSLHDAEVDSADIAATVRHVAKRWRVDRSRILLTGMSDGGTFCYVAGLQAGTPFTHLAPSSASFSPFLIEGADGERMKGLPIYLMHGARDWMFPVEAAQMAAAALSAAGAAVTYREIEDLSHTWPREENGRILEWVVGTAGTDG